MELNGRLTDDEIGRLIWGLKMHGNRNRTLVGLVELQERRNTEKNEKVDVGEHFKRGYDEGHSRGLTCGRLYKSDDQIVAHRAACVSEYKAEINGGENDR
ncbi:hypothetical protein [Kluyvera intermedia]|uniref:hypothetical protein n=1 Tax=Kluyvera intermedia TaxID=61648 RepID=UPI003D00282D